MNFEHKHNIGDTISWDTVSGQKSGIVKEVNFKFTESDRQVTYLVALPNNKHVVITE